MPLDCQLLVFLTSHFQERGSQTVPIHDYNAKHSGATLREMKKNVKITTYEGLSQSNMYPFLPKRCCGNAIHSNQWQLVLVICQSAVY